MVIPGPVIQAALKAAPQLLGAGMSYAQAARQKRLMGEAETAAQKAIAEAKGFASINEMEALRVPMEAYENAQREITSQQQQGVDALQQAGARGLLGGLGGLQALAINANQQQRDKIAKDLYARDVAVALNEERSNIKLQNIADTEAEGAQDAAAMYAEAAGLANTSANEALTGSLLNLVSDQSLNPLYAQMGDFDTSKFFGNQFFKDIGKKSASFFKNAFKKN